MLPGGPAGEQGASGVAFLARWRSFALTLSGCGGFDPEIRRWCAHRARISHPRQRRAKVLELVEGLKGVAWPGTTASDLRPVFDYWWLIARCEFSGRLEAQSWREFEAEWKC